MTNIKVPAYRRQANAKSKYYTHNINHNRTRHSRESGNPEKYWIPGQARNDKVHKIYIVMLNSSILGFDI
jgi:hypothetical protein